MSLRKPNRIFMNFRVESLQSISEVHQLGVSSGRERIGDICNTAVLYGGWNTASASVINKKARAAMLSSEHFKAPGMDGIYSAILKGNKAYLKQHLRNIFRGCLLWGTSFPVGRRSRLSSYQRREKIIFQIQRASVKISLT